MGRISINNGSGASNTDIDVPTIRDTQGLEARAREVIGAMNLGDPDDYSYDVTYDGDDPVVTASRTPVAGTKGALGFAVAVEGLTDGVTIGSPAEAEEVARTLVTSLGHDFGDYQRDPNQTMDGDRIIVRYSVRQAAPAPAPAAGPRYSLVIDGLAPQGVDVSDPAEAADRAEQIVGAFGRDFDEYRPVTEPVPDDEGRTVIRYSREDISAGSKGRLD